MTEITIIGHIGQEPARRTTSKGDAMLTLSVATSSRVRDASGTWSDGPTSWYDVAVYGALAVHAGTSLHRGERVIVRGSLQVKTYQSKTGGTAKSIEVKADSIGHDLLFATTVATRAAAAATEPAAEAATSDEWARPMAGAAVVPETGEVVDDYLPEHEPDWMHAA